MKSISTTIADASSDRFGAFATLTPDRAGRPLHDATGPLGDVPFAVKDCIAVAGLPTTCGSRAFADNVAAADAAVVSLLEGAGARLIGTTTMHELGCAIDPQMPRAVNPRAPSRTASGSSGGSAAAVAAGIVPIALGTDGAGSVRIPAAFCGVVGMKPSHGLVSADGVFGLAPSLEAVGILAADVAWLRRALHALVPRLHPSDQPNRALRLALAPPDAETSAPVADAVQSAAARCMLGGAQVTRVELPDHEGWRAALMAVFGAEAAASSAAWADRLPRAGSDARATIEAGRAVSLADLERARMWRVRFRDAIDEILERHDALVLPVVDYLAHRRDPTPEDRAYWGELRWTAPFNLTGHPAISLPIPRRGLPVALQIVGRHDADHDLVELAHRVAAVLAPAGAERKDP